MRSVLFALLLALGGCTSLASPFPPEAFGYGWSRADAPHVTSVRRLYAADDATRAATGDLIATYHTPVATAGESDPVTWFSVRRGDGEAVYFQSANHAAPHVMMQAPGSPLARALGLTGDGRPMLYMPIERERAAGRDLCGGAYDLLGMGVLADGALVLLPFRWSDHGGIDPTMDFDVSLWPDSMVQPCARLIYRRGS